ncbi:MAG: nifR3 family TIM-barrel protein [Candidatus Poriferisodalaceae bacterium]|jgi:nifR3 family TIM-barrel protein
MSSYRSPMNEGIAPAAPGEFAPVSIGPIDLPIPVILAPMAGVTDWPFRALCSQFGAGLYVNQMITARALVENNENTWKLAEFGPTESPRSIQLYTTDPLYTRAAVERLVGEGRVDHIDMNFGCPAPKVTRQGGGGALPAKRRLLREVIHAAVQTAGDIPVTIKFRKGIDDDHLTFLETGRIAQDEGVVALALHGRTVRELYSGHADWSAIGELVEAVDIPVFGNGDIWEAFDAMRMMRSTGCAGVVVGRGCLGRPWLFRDLADVFSGNEPTDPLVPLSTVTEVMIDHCQRLVDFYADTNRDEQKIVRRFRKHSGWYLAGYPVGRDVRRELSMVDSMDQLTTILSTLDPDVRLPPEGVRVKRSHSGGPRKVSLPENWLINPDEHIRLSAAAEARVSGG